MCYLLRAAGASHKHHFYPKQTKILFFFIQGETSETTVRNYTIFLKSNKKTMFKAKTLIKPWNCQVLSSMSSLQCYPL